MRADSHDLAKTRTAIVVRRSHRPNRSTMAQGSTMTPNSLIRIAAAVIVLLNAATRVHAASCEDSIVRVQAQLDAAIERMQTQMAGVRRASGHYAVISPRRGLWRRRKAQEERLSGSRSMPSIARGGRTVPATTPDAAASCPRRRYCFSRSHDDSGADAFAIVRPDSGTCVQGIPARRPLPIVPRNEGIRSSPCENSPPPTGPDTAGLQPCFWAPLSHLA